jgi:hypothetical protein
MLFLSNTNTGTITMEIFQPKVNRIQKQFKVGGKGKLKREAKL